MDTKLYTVLIVAGVIVLFGGGYVTRCATEPSPEPEIVTETHLIEVEAPAETLRVPGRIERIPFPVEVPDTATENALQRRIFALEGELWAALEQIAEYEYLYATLDTAIDRGVVVYVPETDSILTEFAFKDRLSVDYVFPPQDFFDIRFDMQRQRIPVSFKRAREVVYREPEPLWYEKLWDGYKTGSAWITTAAILLIAGKLLFFN